MMVSRNELYLKMRFMDVALSGYAFVMDVGLETIGTDGLAIYYHPQYLGGLFQGRQDFGEPNLSPYGAPWDFFDIC